jgi:TRAP-type C4-dicarboxylate transport system permease small subunit
MQYKNGLREFVAIVYEWLGLVILQKVWRSFEKVDKYLAYTAAAIAAGCIFCMVVAITASAIGRYLFNINIPHVDEFSGYALVFMTYLGLAYGLKIGSHISIEVVRARLPKGAAEGMEVAACFIGMFVVGAYFYFALDAFMESLRIGERALTPSETPLWIPRCAICVGWVILGLSMLNLLIGKLRRFLKK